MKIEKKKRLYFPEGFTGEDGEEVRNLSQEMLDAPIGSPEELENFIEKCGELSYILAEAGAWKMIRMTQHADDPALSEEQARFYEEVVAPSVPYFFRLNRKIIENGFFQDLSPERYAHLGKILRNQIEIYREENIPLFVEENRLSNRYGEIYSQLTVQFEGEEKTLKEMELLLKDKDRERRERAWRSIWEKMLEKREEFEQLFDELKNLRIRIAKNAGFDNYRDYMHAAYGRFSYTPEDLLEFHDSIEKVALPALAEIHEKRREKLGVDKLRPWDLTVDLGEKILRPFADAQELLAGSLRILKRLDPDFAETLSAMAENDLLDLPNRKGKAPGGYSCSLPATGADFIFMNAVGIHTDVQTILHESGHALHAFAHQGERIAEYNDPPSEVCELASMSMELLTVDVLDEFYSDEEDRRKARREQLEDTLSVLPMVASIDAIQHWIYLYPEHSGEERDAEFARLKERFNADVDWTGLEKEKSCVWLKTLHIFEIPFYYIEYAISQLGAIALYREYKKDPVRAIENYKKFMALGYSKSVPEIYAAAGIRFDFSREYLRELVDFVKKELDEL